MVQKTRLGLTGTPRRPYDTSLYLNKVEGAGELEGASGMTEEEWFSRRRRLRSRGRISGEGTIAND